jgi:hypothetical protein
MDTEASNLVTVITNAVIALLTLGALVAAILQANRASKRADAADRRIAESEQAAARAETEIHARAVRHHTAFRVRARHEDPSWGADRITFDLIIGNDGSEPIRDIAVFPESPFEPIPIFHEVADVLGREHSQKFVLSAGLEHPDIMSMNRPPVSIEFTDARDVRWRRSPSGLITPGNPAPHKQLQGPDEFGVWVGDSIL